jgi:hypothetical protein
MILNHYIFYIVNKLKPFIVTFAYARPQHVLLLCLQWHRVELLVLNQVTFMPEYKTVLTYTMD